MLPQSPEWHSWQLLASQDLRSGAVSAILRTLAAGAGHLESRITGFTYGGGRPNEATPKPSAALPRPKLETALTPAGIRRARPAQHSAFSAAHSAATHTTRH